MYFAPCIAACAAGAMLTVVRRRRDRRRQATVRKSRLLIRTVMFGASKAETALNYSVDVPHADNLTVQCPQLGVRVSPKRSRAGLALTMAARTRPTSGYAMTQAAVQGSSSDTAA